MMTINLIKLQDDLKMMPDSYLKQLGLNPKDYIPQFMVTSELLRRKNDREASLAAGQGEQPTIKDQLVAEAQPQLTGIASLPAENVGNEAVYTAATGGIVAFEDGGEVQRYQNQGFVQLSPEVLSKLSQEERDAYYAQKQQALISDAKTLGGLGLDFLTLLPRKAAEAGDYIRGLGAGAVNTVAGTEVFDPTPMTGTEQSVAKPQTVADPGNKKLLEQMKSTVIPRPASDIITTPPPPGPGADRIPAGPAAQSTPFGWQDIDAKKYLYDVQPFKDAVGTKPTMGGIADLAETERTRRGIANDPYASLMKDIETEKGTLTKQFQQDTWMRLAEFGATLASTPGSFGAAIGEAGKKVIPNVIADKKEYKKIERELNKETKQMALARENMLEARMNNDFERLDKETQRFERAKDRLMQVTMENVDVSREIAIKNAEKKFEAGKTMFEEREQTKRANIQASGSNNLANELRKQDMSRKIAEGRAEYRLKRMEQNPQIEAAQSQLMSLENKPERSKEEETKLKQLRSGLNAYIKKIDAEYEQDLINSGYPVDIVRGILPTVGQSSHPADIENIIKSLGI